MPHVRRAVGDAIGHVRPGAHDQAPGVFGPLGEPVTRRVSLCLVKAGSEGFHAFVACATSHRPWNRVHTQIVAIWDQLSDMCQVMRQSLGVLPGMG